jgi:hypothetical protein
MQRTLLIAVAWGVFVWNVVGLAAFVMGLDVGLTGQIAGIATGGLIVLARTTRPRATVRVSAPQGRAEA